MNSSKVTLTCLNQLGWLLRVPQGKLRALKKKAPQYYQPFNQQRRGKVRRIDQPVGFLKEVQARINATLLRDVEIPPEIRGGVPGNTPAANAQVHAGQPVVAVLDVKGFFPAVHPDLVYGVWCRHFAAVPSVASLLTSLTTYLNRLPQGAPTSTAVANLVLLDVDLQIRDACRRHKVQYTRWVDDLAFSGRGVGNVLDTAIRAIHRAGFQISRKKLKIQPRNGPQAVTGYTLNQGGRASVPRSYRNKVRAAIHQLERVGAGEEFAKALESIKGRIAYVRQTNPGAAGRLMRQLDERLGQLRVRPA